MKHTKSLKFFIKKFFEFEIPKILKMDNDGLKKIRSVYNLLKENKAIKHEDISFVIQKGSEVLGKNKSAFIKIDAAVNIIGDIHGQFEDLLKLLGKEFDPEKEKYLFLGDYVDRGPNSVEVITFLLCCKILHNNNIILLRGNHETGEISQIYGFKEEITSKFGRVDLYNDFVDKIFSYLPLAAEVSERIFCVHGGLSQHLKNKQENANSNDLESIFKNLGITLPLNNPNEKDVVQDLLWADPSPERNGYTNSERGTSYTFGRDVVNLFLEEHKYDLICRAHQVVDNGFDFPFFPDQIVITIFSAPNYCDEFNNKAAMLIVDEELNCSFKFLDPNDPSYKKT